VRKGVDIEYIKAFGRHLAKTRKAKGFTQEGVCYDIDLSLSQIARIETGKICPSIDTVLRIAKGLGVHPKDLFDFEVTSTSV